MTHDHDTIMDELTEDPACAVAHGAPAPATAARTLIAVFASPVAEFLLHFGSDCGFRAILLEPDAERAAAAMVPGAEVTASFDALDSSADIVVTDHHRPELGTVLRDLLAGKARWIGVMGNPRHPAPYIPALRELGVGEAGHQSCAPAGRPEHRLADPARDRHRHTGRAHRGPQRPPRGLYLLTREPSAER